MFSENKHKILNPVTPAPITNWYADTNLFNVQWIAEEIEGALCIKTTHLNSGLNSTRTFCPTEEGLTVVTMIFIIHLIMNYVICIMQYALILCIDCSLTTDDPSQILEAEGKDVQGKRFFKRTI